MSDNDLIQKGQDDLIRRGDALKEIHKQIGEGDDGWTRGNNSAIAACSAILKNIPAVQPTVSPELLATTHDVAALVEALEGLIKQTYDCEKELTEDLHHMDFCGESEPLTKARAALARVKGVM